MKLKAQSFVLILVLLVSTLSLTLASTVQAGERDLEQSQRAEFVPPIMIVNTSFLNIRTGPGTQYAILLTVVGGTELPVLARARDGVWYQVSTVVGNGWVNSEFAIARGDFTNVPVVAAPPLVPFNPDAIAPGMAPVSSDDATADAVFGSGRAWGASVTITHPARTSPTINSSSPATAVENPNRIYTLLEAASAEGIVWYRVRIPQVGDLWVEASKTRLRPFACTTTAVVFTVDVRPTTGPDGSGTLTGEFNIPTGEEAYLIDSQAGLFKVELFDGNTGWVNQQDAAVRSDEVGSDFCDQGGMDAAMVAPSNPASADGSAAPQMLRSPARVIINTGFLNVRSGPGSQYTVITSVPGGTTLDVIGFAPDGVWYQVSGSFGRGWLNSEFTIFRGDGRSIPVVRDAQGELTRPIATITNAVTLYTTPSTSSTPLGTVSGPVEAPVVARTVDNGWVQLNTSIGFGWVLSGSVSISGDLSLLPAVG